MEDFKVTDNGSLQIQPSGTSNRIDFDFYLGKWKIHNKKRKTFLNNCDEWIEFEATDETISLVGRLGNMNMYKAIRGGKPFEGMTVRLFNPKTRLWSLYWADSINGRFDPPMVGSFEGNIGKQYAKDIFEGKEILVMFHWDKSDPDHPVWSQAFSEDFGKTWEWNWYMYATRIC